MPNHTLTIATALVLAAGAARAEEPWRSAEAPILSDHVQLTHPRDFIKAGEAYFDPATSWIIFQAVPRTAEAAAQENPHYSMFVAKLARDTAGDITGLEAPILVSAPGSANTCGFFNPTNPHQIIFGSTIVPPVDNTPAGYQREQSKYAWMFPAEMEVTTRLVPEIVRDRGLKMLVPPERTVARPMFERPRGYDAECAYSPDARHIVFASHDPEADNIDLFVHDTHTGTTIRLVGAPGYDGGPFFSPDGTRLCYRSDRARNDLLQIIVADLLIDDDGAVIGVDREHQLTADHNVNWAPFWHPSGEFLIFTTSRQGHHNYEVYAIAAPPEGAPPLSTPFTIHRGNAFPTFDRTGDVASKRITNAAGFDGLPVFSPDGSLMMWTSQRGPKLEGEERPSSQIWVARVRDAAP